MPQLNDPRLTEELSARLTEGLSARLTNPAVVQSAAATPRLYLWRLTESEEELSTLLPTHFDYTDEARRHFTSPKRRREWLAARVLLHHVAGVSERLQYLPSGQPVLPASLQCSSGQCSSGQSASALHVSLSHSADVVALLLSPTPCGIDVEQRAPRALRLRAHFLDAAEEAAFFQGTQASRLCSPSLGTSHQLPPQGTQASRLCSPPHPTPQTLSPEDTATLLWSAKEAVFKCFSARGIDYVTQIHLRPAADALTLIASFDANTPCATTEARVAFALHPDFVLTVAASQSALFSSETQNNR